MLKTKEKILIAFLLFAVLPLSAQQKKRQLLQNQAEEEKISQRQGQGQEQRAVYGYGLRKKAKKSYLSGHSELFLKIFERGYYTVELGNQIMSNPHGKFRFFELPPERMTLSVYKNGVLLYRSPISIPDKSRMLLDFTYDGLYILDVFPIPLRDDWEVVVVPVGMPPEQFQKFKNAIKKNARFNDEKIRMIRMQVNSETFFTASQIRELVNMLDFISDKLSMAKELYDHCVDPDNYFILLEDFGFGFHKEELESFIRKKRAER